MHPAIEEKADPQRACDSVTTGSGKGTALRLRGLPFSATEEDIRKFFAKYTLFDVYMCRRNGRCPVTGLSMPEAVFAS
jgi:RNA recognition motif-containing protein